MQFAQKIVSLEHGNARAIRGSLREMSTLDYADAMKDSWETALVQLGRGSLNADIEYLAGDQFILYRNGWSERLHASGVTRRGLIGFGVPSDGERIRWCGRTLPAGHILFVDDDCEVDLVANIGATATVALIAKDAFVNFCLSTTGLDPAFLFRERYFAAARPEAIAPLQRTWNGLLAQAQRRDVCDFGFADVVGVLVAALDWTGAILPRHRGKAEVVAAALHEAGKFGYEVTVPQLSQLLRMSRRTIEYAFHEHLGIAPASYLTLRRLDLCRQALIDADPSSASVTAIAISHGFYELGRFAVTYRQRFGERPSESLRRAHEHLTVGFSPMAATNRS